MSLLWGSSISYSNENCRTFWFLHKKINTHTYTRVRTWALLNSFFLFLFFKLVKWNVFIHLTFAALEYRPNVCSIHQVLDLIVWLSSRCRRLICEPRISNIWSIIITKQNPLITKFKITINNLRIFTLGTFPPFSQMPNSISANKIFGICFNKFFFPVENHGTSTLCAIHPSEISCMNMLLHRCLYDAIEWDDCHMDFIHIHSHVCAHTHFERLLF